MSELERVVGEWVRRAEGDLAGAQKLATDDAVYAANHASFWAQQAAEKAVKAVLVARQIEFERTHDIEALVELAPDDSALRGVADLGSLTRWVTAARYPGEDEPTQDDAQAAVRVAEDVIAAMREDLG